VSAVDEATHAASDAVVDSGKHGTSSSKSTGPTASSITFQSNLNLTVDLSATNAVGEPKYPGSSGMLNVVASGTVTADSGSGSATYAVGVTAVTDLMFTDPNSGDTATIAQGAVWSYSLAVQWSLKDGQNWFIKAESDCSLSGVAFTVRHQTEIILGTVGGSRHATASFAKTAGIFVAWVSVTADKTVTFSDSTGPHTVSIHVAAVDLITITVDGVAYGPLTRAQVREMFHLECE